MSCGEISGNRALVRVRRSVVEFRAKWKRVFEDVGGKRFAFGRDSNLRIVFALPDDHPLLDQFEQACADLRMKTGRLLKAIGRQLGPEMWVPTIVRGSNRIGIVESELIQQQKRSSEQARAFARKCGIQEIRRDWQYVIRRHANTVELLIETADGGVRRRSTFPFTEWAVVGAAVSIKTSGAKLRWVEWEERASAEFKSDAWAEKRQMKLICQSGQASLYGGPPVRVIGDNEEDLLPN